jgi:hypothetical protein
LIVRSAVERGTGFEASALAGEPCATGRKQRTVGVAGPAQECEPCPAVCSAHAFVLAGACCLSLWLAGTAAAALHATFTGYEIGTPGTFNHMLATGDFNGDGKVDLATGDLGTGSGSFSVLMGHGDGIFDPALVFDTGSLPQGTVAVGDFDEDGLSDLVVRGAGNALDVLPSDGDGTFSDLGDVDVTLQPSPVGRR